MRVNGLKHIVGGKKAADVNAAPVVADVTAEADGTKPGIYKNMRV